MAAELPPELRQHIVQYLDFDTLKVYSLVCKAWHLDVHPILWNCFSCRVPQENPASSEKYSAWLDTICRNANSFRQIYDIKFNERASEVGGILLDRCHSLVTIEAVVAGKDSQNSCRDWEEILRTLEDILSRLAARSLEGLQIAVKCPLRASSTLEDALWQLTYLHLKATHPGPGKIVHILDAIQPHHLRHVNLNSLDTGCTIRLIEQQHVNLEFLKVGLLPGHTGALAGILATCRKLKVLIFTAKPFVDIQKLIDPQQPWVCTELEVFEGTFGLSRRPHPPHPSDPNGLNDAVRSSDFLDQIIAGETGIDIMAWSLPSGLAHLAGLASLRSFKFLDRDVPEGVGDPEMVFMKQHWHGLKELACYAITNSDLVKWQETEWPEQVTRGCFSPLYTKLVNLTVSKSWFPPILLDVPSLYFRMAINLPELRQHIAQYLDSTTLEAFSLVCKAWYLDAQPILWSRFSSKAPWSPGSSEYVLWLDTIRKNADSFKHTFHDEYDEPIVPEIRDILLNRCHSLISIELNVAEVNVENACHNWEETLRPLIVQNRASLRRLHLRAIDGPFMASLQLPTLMPSLLHLRTLELNVKQMTVEDLLPVLDACPISLESLNLVLGLRRSREYDEEDSATYPHHSTLLRLKHLRIYTSCSSGALEDVLSRLAVHSLDELLVHGIFVAWMFRPPKDALWQLTRLHLTGGIYRCLSELLGAIQPHQLCHVHLGWMDIKCAMQLAKQQHQSLEFLNVSFGEDEETGLSDILVKCGKLKHLVFSAHPFVDIQVLIDPEYPWVCTELEVFEGTFGLSRTPQARFTLIAETNRANGAGNPEQIEDRFMQRLGQLTRLRRLVQKGSSLGQDIMVWSLSSGLEHLDGLVNLRTLGFDDGSLPKGIGIPEAAFMKQHWHGLKELACYEMDDVTADTIGARTALSLLIDFASPNAARVLPSLFLSLFLLTSCQHNEVHHAFDRQSFQHNSPLYAKLVNLTASMSWFSPSLLDIPSLCFRMAIHLPELRQHIAQYLDSTTLETGNTTSQQAATITWHSRLNPSAEWGRGRGIAGNTVPMSSMDTIIRGAVGRYENLPFIYYDLTSPGEIMVPVPAGIAYLQFNNEINTNITDLTNELLEDLKCRLNTQYQCNSCFKSPKRFDMRALWNMVVGFGSLIGLLKGISAILLGLGLESNYYKLHKPKKEELDPLA
ncbi:MAG: hypothetical protein J3Q66DRAFT_374976 [Benniella sp.]|nr:MAG: hypothetical protein J3Q66DRAFT_374976 [Benniella sp.]